MGDTEAKITRRNFLRLSEIEVQRLEVLWGDFHGNTGKARQKAAEEIEAIIERYKLPHPANVPADPQP